MEYVDRESTKPGGRDGRRCVKIDAINFTRRPRNASLSTSFRYRITSTSLARPLFSNVELLSVFGLRTRKTLSHSTIRFELGSDRFDIRTVRCEACPAPVRLQLVRLLIIGEVEVQNAPNAALYVSVFHGKHELDAFF